MLGGDIKIQWNGADHRGDFLLDDTGADLSSDKGLETAVIVSLFTDRIADGEELPPNEKTKRGWWGDSIADVPGDRIGSKLWLLGREKELQEVAVRARQYAQEALEWLIDTKIASKVEVNSELLGNGILGLQIRISRQGKTELTEYRYNYNWDAQEARKYAV